MSEHIKGNAMRRALEAEQQVWDAIADEFGFLSDIEVDRVTDMSQMPLIVLIRDERAQYPKFQIDPATQNVRPWVAPLLTLAAKHGRASTGVGLWMMGPLNSLYGHRPVDFVEDGETLLRTAEHDWGVDW